jgi:hypothetical protein
MKLFLGFLTLLSVSLAGAKPIETRALDPNSIAKITIGQTVGSVLRWPSPIDFVNCLGASVGNAQQQPSTNGQQQPQQPVVEGFAVIDQSGPDLLVIYATQPKVNLRMTVLSGGKLYPFALVSGDNPDQAITLVNPGEGGVTPSVEVTPKQVAAMRPRQDTELYHGLERRSLEVDVLQKQHPELYVGYDSRKPFVPYSSGKDRLAATTYVDRIHRFSNDDATVLECRVVNNEPTPIRFDGRSVQVIAGNERYPIKYFSCPQPINPGQTVEAVAIIQGDVDGTSRSNLAIENEYRLMLPQVSGESVSGWAPRLSKTSGNKPSPLANK